MNNQLSLFDEPQTYSEETWDMFIGENLIEKMYSVADVVNCMIKTKVIYPDKNEVFRFMSLKPKDINDVILGQDPYYNGNANGLAFACKREMSASLKIIKSAIYNSFGKTFSDDMMSLLHLVRQGVLLLNTSLTVEKGFPNSHAMLWKEVMINVIKRIGEKKDVVWILFGKQAKEYENYILNKNLVLKEVHPAAIARGGLTSWNTIIFQLCNEKLESINKPSINWFL